MSIDENGKLYMVYNRNLSSGGTIRDVYLKTSTDNGATWSSEETVVTATTEVWTPLHIMDIKHNALFKNRLNSGCCGVYADNPFASNSDLYFYYTDDISFKYEVTGSPSFCDISVTSDLGVTAACVNLTQNSFTSIDHLNGETVAILADGRPLAQQTVTDGS